MKRILAISLGFIMVIVLCACGAQSQIPSNQSQAEKTPELRQTPTTTASKTETAKKAVSIKAEPPSGWEPVANSVLPVQYLKGTISFMAKEENFAGKTLDDVITEAKEIFKNAFGDILYEGDPESLTIDGKDAKKILFTCKVSSMQMKYEYVYLYVGDAVYAITFGGPADTFDSLAAEYSQILDSIRFE